MRARFCTQCQVSFRPKIVVSLTQWFRTLSILWLFWCDIRTKSRKRKKPLHGCISHWKTSLVSLLNSLVHQYWPLRSPPRHKEDQNKISKKRMHETLSYSPFGCHFNRERVPGIVVLPLFFIFNLSTSTLQLENLQTGNTGPLYPPEGTRQGKYALFCFPLNQFSLWVTCNSFSMKLIHK